MANNSLFCLKYSTQKKITYSKIFDIKLLIKLSILGIPLNIKDFISILALTNYLKVVMNMVNYYQ